ncbi:uncharacterized protein LOC134264505 [Saccostrea cucullata]|uniref:uncharacterized protein LOC134264505 n=1 Tax=Saccostrea cuccullata TaxID=36930 RepID=UPI002ED41A80
MKSIVLSLLWFVVLLGSCTGQCFSAHQLTPPPPGSTDPPPTHCNYSGMYLAPGEAHTDMTKCLRCHCGADLGLYCCSMLMHYTLPEGCVVIEKNCTQRIVHKSDGSPCQYYVSFSRK